MYQTFSVPPPPYPGAYYNPYGPPPTTAPPPISLAQWGGSLINREYIVS